MQEIITHKLTAALAPQALEIVDQSIDHKGHPSVVSSGGSSHFMVKIVADIFKNKSRLERHRLVYQALGSEIAGPIHALQLVTLTPDEVPTQTP